MLTSIRIDHTESFADSARFGDTGAYERLTGIARGELDPLDARNRVIVNIDLAPRNARGRVEYEVDLCMLRPVDPDKDCGTLIYEVVNRGNKLAFSGFMDAPGRNNNPQQLRDLGNALFLRRGHTLVWSGWEPDAPRIKHGMGMQPIIPTRNGQPIVRVIREELVSGDRGTPVDTFRLFYEAATLDQAQARLTVRRRESDPRVEIPVSQWAYVNSRSIRLLPEGTLPAPGSLYDLYYPARDPKVLGVGLAATRDLVSFLRHEADDHFQRNTATARRYKAALAIGRSQSGRYIRDHISQGFNQDEAGRKVFDGALSHAAGVGRVFLNTEFGEPWRTGTQHDDHLYPENAFPFSAAKLHDPFTGETGSLLRRDGCDPLLIETNTSSEYWQKGASLLSTDPLGKRDVRLPQGARAYLVASTQHGGSATSDTERGNCVNHCNPHNPEAALRALVVALDEWVNQGRKPPASCVPRLRDGSAVAPDALGFPAIPGAAVANTCNTLAVYGDWIHPHPDPDKVYGTLVPCVDADGNEVAGIRLPDIAVPLATYTGWNLYAAPYVEGELCDRDGSWIPFAKTRAERLASGDPRSSIEERYKSGADYVRKVKKAARKLVRQRLLLQEDANAFVARAEESATRLFSANTEA